MALENVSWDTFFGFPTPSCGFSESPWAFVVLPFVGGPFSLSIASFSLLYVFPLCYLQEISDTVAEQIRAEL